MYVYILKYYVRIKRRLFINFYQFWIHDDTTSDINNVLIRCNKTDEIVETIDSLSIDSFMILCTKFDVQV